MLDLPRDLKYLTAHLGIKRYSVLGVSGGGPPVLACAKELPADELQSVGIVCGLGPPDIGMRGARFLHWIAFSWGYKYAPYWMGRLYWRSGPLGRLEMDDEARLEMMMKANAGGKTDEDKRDRAILGDRDIFRVSLRSTREAFKQGYVDFELGE